LAIWVWPFIDADQDRRIGPPVSLDRSGQGGDTDLEDQRFIGESRACYPRLEVLACAETALVQEVEPSSSA
jgi:hypothetical protein